jgi:monoamine oxidase
VDERPGITRRRLLQAAGAALAVTTASCRRKQNETAAAKGRVVIVGGGLCGLVVLDRLRKLGREAVLLEAGERLGGRILTIRGGLPEGLRAEAGAERVGAGHLAVRDLLAEIGIRTVAYPPAGASFTLTSKDRVFDFSPERGPPPEILEGLSGVERRGAPLMVLAALVDAAGAPAANDARSGIAWLRASGMTPKGEELVRAFAAFPLDSMPAAVLHRAVKREAAASASEVVEGGSDTIVAALASRNQAAIRSGAKVASVEATAEGVRLGLENADAVDAPHAVFCLPVAPLAALAFRGGTPASLAARLQSLEAAHERKEARVSTGAPRYAFGERRVSWPLPERNADGRFVVHTLRWETDARRPSSPPIAPAGGLSIPDFAFDPLIGGAYAFSKSGAEPEGVVTAGRMIFAGADLSDVPGWMEGAVRAADQAVEALTS